MRYFSVSLAPSAVVEVAAAPPDAGGEVGVLTERGGGQLTAASCAMRLWERDDVGHSASGRGGSNAAASRGRTPS